MASTNKLVDDLLTDLQFPCSLLHFLEERGIGIFSLITVTEDQLKQILELYEDEDLVPRNAELFALIESWRNRNKSTIRSLVNLSIFSNQSAANDSTFQVDILDPPINSDQREVHPSEAVDDGQQQVSAEEEVSPTVDDYDPVQAGHPSKPLSTDSVTSVTASCVPEATPETGFIADVLLSKIPVNEAQISENNPINKVAKDSQQKLPDPNAHASFSRGEASTRSGNSVLDRNPLRSLPINSQIVAPSVAKPAASNNSNPFDCTILLDLLKQSEEGKDIINRAQAGELTEAKQNQLAGLIAKYHLIHRGKLRAEDLQTYALAICTLFKSERQENYYITRGGDRKNHGGKIANKIGNLKRKKRKSDAVEEEHAKAFKRAGTSIDTVDHDEKSVQAYEWLKLNTEPWTTVTDKWPLSITQRKPYLRSYLSVPKLFTLFPHYKSQYGYQLIDEDFKQLFAGCSDGVVRIAEIRQGVTAFIQKKAVDPSAKGILKLLTENNTEDTKNCALLLGLSTVLPPIFAGTHFKPTICVSQEDTIIFAESEDDASRKVEETYQVYVDRKLPAVPKLVVLGKDMNNIRGRFYVFFEDFHYELPTAARAIDVLVKSTAVLGLPYSKVSKLVWHFISSEAYDIPERESYNSINKLKKYLHPIPELQQ